jgi:hypothetical protein
MTMKTNSLTGFYGVSLNRRYVQHPYHVRIIITVDKSITKRFSSSLEAAQYWDRIIKHLKLDLPLNFPTVAERKAAEKKSLAHG